ncbi:alanine racemase [Alkalibacter sp. M17DMB]|nr:alanine racemase [Alkalibacter mobilis]
MQLNCRPTRCEINLDLLIENYNRIKNHAGARVEVMPVVKADAYGHGAVECSKALVEAGARIFGVAVDDEAIELRKNSIDTDILVLGYTPKSHIQKILEWKITPTVYQLDFAEELSRAAKGKTKIHIKIDTGMGRIGFKAKEAAGSVMKIASLKNIEVEGIFSHFAESDSKDKSFSMLQMERFDELIQLLESNGLHIPIKHMANSAGILDLPKSKYDMVRPGIILYGMYPSDEVEKNNIEIFPIKKFVTEIAHIKCIGSGDSVSYGRKFIANGDRLIATLPVGYADGYSRLLSGRSRVWINGDFYPVVGTICMDQTMIDITGSDGFVVGQDVCLYGEGVPIEEIAEIMGTINYEITCMTKERVPKIYIKRNEILSL